MSLWSSVCAFPAVFLWSAALIQLVFLWISLYFYHSSRLLFWQQTTHGDHAFFFLSVEVAGFYLQWFIFISDICALGVTSPRTWQRHSYCGARKTCTCLAGFNVFACFSVFCVAHAHRALSTWMCVCVKCSGLSWQLTSSCGCFLPEKSDFSLVKLLIELGFQTQV